MNLSPTVSLFLRLAVILIAGIGLYKLFFAHDSPTRNVVVLNQELGISGRVTGVNKARGYKIYLDNAETAYNFDDFENAAQPSGYRLGYYLESGDAIEKKPNSPLVLVDRGGQRSEWRFVAPTPPAR